MKTANQIKKEYNIGIGLSIFAYVIILFTSITILKNNGLGNPFKILLAILTSLPIGASILVFLRYIRDADEFIKSNLATNFIITTGIIMFGVTVWGFLENFANFPHFDIYLIYAGFWIIFGITNAFRKTC